MIPPYGYDEILKLYGDPTPLVREDGSVSSIWESNMVLVPFPSPLPLGWDLTIKAKAARVHRAIVQPTEDIFRILDDSGAWQRVVTWDGGYQWRAMRGSQRLSMHAFGGALDFNASTNQLGEDGDMDHWIFQAFEANGWTWGGRWKRRDCMHFQWARGY